MRYFCIFAFCAPLFACLGCVLWANDSTPGTIRGYLQGPLEYLDICRSSPWNDHRTDYAHISSGARIVTNLTSRSHSGTPRAFTPTSSRFARGIQPLPNIPEAALGIFADTRIVWEFEGSYGKLTIALARPIVIRRVIVRSPPDASFWSCAPRSMILWGLVLRPHAQLRAELQQHFPRLTSMEIVNDIKSAGDVPRGSRWMPLASMEISSKPLQDGDMEVAAPEMRIPVSLVAMEYRENWGDPKKTCIAGFSLHGEL